MPILTVANVSHYFGAARILDDVSFAIERGDHVGMVGANGAGKSTLLRIIAGEIEPDAGSVGRSRGIRVAYLPQEPEFDDRLSLHETMLGVFRDVIDAQEMLHLIEAEMGSGSGDPDAMEEYSRLQALVEAAGYDYPQRIERVLSGLGLPAETWELPIGQLSGGQRTRANLGRTLLREADLLLLDEPTNHLDIPAVEWLQSYLHDLPRAFLIVAHDRYLLDGVTRRTLELSGGHLTSYDAPYGRYLALRAERAERLRLEYEAQQAHIAKTEEFIRRYGAGQRYKEARGRQKQLDRLERVERPEDASVVQLNVKGAARSGEVVLDLRDLVVGYEGVPLVALPREVTLRRGEHVALVGANGSGKTTLLRTLMGSVPPVGGTYRWGTRVSIGYYSQSAYELDDQRTVIDEIRLTAPMDEEQARGYLGQFLFSGDAVFKPIGALSGGERGRVALAKLILEEPNVLLLDEPTNHLDIASREALQAVLAPFPGTILFVSHDRYLIDSLAAQLWVVQDGTLRRYAGTYSEYAAGTAAPLDRVEIDNGAPSGTQRLPPGEQMIELQTEAIALSDRLAQTGTTTSVEGLAELTERYAGLLHQLHEVEDEWLAGIHRQLHAS